MKKKKRTPLSKFTIHYIISKYDLYQGTMHSTESGSSLPKLNFIQFNILRARLSILDFAFGFTPLMCSSRYIPHIYIQNIISNLIFSFLIGMQAT